MPWKDGDHESSTRVRHRSHSVPFLPILLIAIGVGVFVDQAIGHGVGVWEVFWLGVGVWCLNRGRDDGPYPLLIIGAFLIFNNAGELVGALIDRGMADAGETLGTGSGFLWLYTNDRPRSRWAIIPAVIFGLIGVGELGYHLTDLVNDGSSWFVPAGVVVAGILLLGAHRLPGPVRIAGLVFVAAAAISLIANGDDNNGTNGRRGLFVQRSPTTVGPQALALNGRTLRIEGNNGAVTVQPGNLGVISGVIVNSPDPDEVVVRPRSANGPVVVSVPAGTPLAIDADNGPVAVLSPTNQADISTDNGPITLQVQGDPTIDAESDVQVIVDGKPDDDGDYEYDGTGGEVELRSDNGVINITRVPAQSGAR